MREFSKMVKEEESRKRLNFLFSALLIRLIRAETYKKENHGCKSFVDVSYKRLYLYWFYMMRCLLLT